MNISVSVDEAQNQIKLHDQAFLQNAQKVQKIRGHPKKKNQFLPFSVILPGLPMACQKLWDVIERHAEHFGACHW